MQRVLIVISLALSFFLIEFLLYNLFGRIFLPNLSLILIVFINLSLGIRYSLVVAIFAGLLKDSLGIGFFGVHMLSYVACAFLAVVLQKYIYQRGSVLSRLVLMMVIVLADFTIEFLLNLISGEIGFGQAIKFVLLPELLATLLLTNLCFDQLKKCVLRFLV